MEAAHAALSITPQISPLRTQWLPAFIMCPVLFHASVFVCTVSLETLAQVPLTAMSYMHRGRAIQLINRELSDSSRRRSDSLVASILSLANFEVSGGP
jgi:hypothetical protein